jgi:hypothetical protein
LEFLSWSRQGVTGRAMVCLRHNGRHALVRSMGTRTWTSYLPEFMEVGSDDAHAKHSYSYNHLHPRSPATLPPTPRHHGTRLIAEASPTRLLLPGPLPRLSAVCSASWPQVAT